MKQKFAAKLWKRTLSTGLSLAMVVTMLPSVSALADTTPASDPVVYKAGSINAAADKTTNTQPFTSKTGSAKFSSPAFVIRQVEEMVGSNNVVTRPTTGITTDLMIAAAEAKYNSTSDGGGEDIIASVSNDGGETWKYSYPFNFPDSKASGNKDATTVSSPVLLQKTTRSGGDHGEYVSGGTVYVLANVYPGGVAPVNGFKYPGAGTGYVEIDNVKYLALTDDYAKADVNPTEQDAEYPYYVGTFAADGYAPVNDKTSKTVATIEEKQYYVDQWYNLYTKEGDIYTAVMQEGGQLDAENGSEDQLQENVFYKNASLHVYNTGYIMCVTSAKTGDAEEGDVWSVPEILNPQIYQSEDEIVFLTSGKGLVTTAGRMVVPVYSKTATEEVTIEEAEEKAGIIWNYDNCEHSAAGTPWAHRSDVPAFEDAGESTEEPNWMKGGELVELSRGQLRMFIRHGRGNVYYADAGRGLTSEENEGETDAQANSDMFTFKAPVQTGTSVTRDSKVSALEYSKIVNPGSDNPSKVILTAMPTGTGHTNGSLTVFGRNANSDLKNPSISRIHSKSLNNGNFASASMDEMNYGSGIGLIWENGIGTVNFEKFAMLDLLAHGSGSDTDSLYVPGLEYDLELRPNGEAYTRKYNVTGSTNMESTDRDWTAAGNDNIGVTFDAGTASTKEVPALYSVQGAGSASAKLSDVFTGDKDTTLDFANAEFTLTRPSEAENLKNVYTVYSETAERYFTNYRAAATFFSTTLRNNIRFVYDTDSSAGSGEGFLISRPITTGSNPATDGERYVCYNKWRYTFDATQNKQTYAETAQFTHHIQLLKKLTSTELEAMSEDELAKVINFGPDDSNEYKYIKITSNDDIESGRKYLIAGEVAANAEDTKFPNGGYVVLYPRNSQVNYGKLVYDTYSAPVAATKTLTITPKAATTTPVDLTVNNITYHITVKNETITVPKGGSTFIDNTALDAVDLGASTLVTKMSTTESRKALFDCNSTSNGNLNGYATTPNWNANVANAEVIITEQGETEAGLKTYYIFSELEGNYLVNSNANDYFSTTPVPQTLQLTEEGADAKTASFEIRRYTPENTNLNNRYVYFFYERMGFDAVSAKAGFENRGDFGFEILKKRTDGIESLTDPIPGYQRVNEITSGESYLITEYYTEERSDGTTRDVIIVLYPRNGITNQSKMYATTDVEGVRLTASENAEVGDTAEITIGGTTYTIEIVGTCNHEGFPKTQVAVEATCKHPGSTGDIICSNCREVLAEGEDIPKLDHTWPETWTQVTAPAINKTGKTVTDGLEKRSCSGGEETETRVIDGEAYLGTVIGQKIAEAAEEAAKTDEYAAETIKALGDAITAATEAVSGQSPADVAGKIDALVALESALNPNNMVSQEDYDARKDQLDALVTDAEEEVAKTDLYTEDSLKDLQDALDAVDGEMSYADMQTAINALTAALNGLKTLDEEKCEELLPSLKDTLASLDAVAAAGKQNYTDETWNKFIDAYNALKNKSDAELTEMGFDRLTQLLADLNTKLVENPKIVTPEKKLQLKDYTVGNVVYTVTDAVKNEVVLKKGPNVKKFTVPATQVIDGITCKVVGIGNGAFKSCSKLVNLTIGENVTSIGSKAFFNCKKLKKVTINGAAPAIKKAAFKKTASKVTVKAKKLNKKQKKAFLKVLKKTGKISSKSVVK